jgi:hypothetical protein
VLAVTSAPFLLFLSRKRRRIAQCVQPISRPDIRVKHCAYGYSVATLLNPRGVTTVSHKYSLTAARHATVVVAVPSSVQYPAIYNIKYIILDEI